jgi:outer membrane immunogenic protein
VGVIASSIAASGAVVGSGSALAADLPFKAPSLPAPAAFDWSGVYIGGHIGGGWGYSSFADPGAQSILNTCCLLISSTNNPTAFTNGSGSSFLGGAQLGWMYQIQRLVIGGEVDWSAMNLRSSGSSTMTPLVGGGETSTEALSVKTNWTATTTATVGLARDRWMIYSKAGAAFANNTYGANIAGVGGTFGGPGGTAFSYASTTTQTVAGWTAGIGLKWALTDNWFINAEYDYLDFGSKTPHLSGTFSATPAAFAGSNAGATFGPTFNQTISELKVGLNYKLPPGLLFW